MLLSIGLVICLLSVTKCIVYDLDAEELEKNDKLCLKPPDMCTCVDESKEIQANYVYTCTCDETGETIVLDMNFDNNDWFNIWNIDVPSFKLIPNLTNYIKSTGIKFQSFKLPENELIYELTSKISENVKHLMFRYLGLKEKLSFYRPKHLFDGLSQLESLEIYTIVNEFKNVDMFENLVNLKKLTLSDVEIRTIIVNFAPLHELQILTIENKKIELEVGALNNQKNLVELNLLCTDESFLYAQMFASLSNLEMLKISGPFMIVWPDSMFSHNPKLKSIKLNFIRRNQASKFLSILINLKGGTQDFINIEDLSEDVFKTLSNLEELILTENMLKSLPTDVFVELIRLELLDLRFNNLRDLNDELFVTTLKMKTLKLSFNKLENISRYVKTFD